MQIFSVQFMGGVALVNHDDCYTDTPGFFELPDGETIVIDEPQEPQARLWTRRSRQFGFPDTEHYYAGTHHDALGSHTSRRNCGRKPVYAK